MNAAGLDTGHWLTILGSLAAVAVTFGVMQARVAVLRESLRELVNEVKRSQESNGRRFEDLNTRTVRLEAVAEVRRRRPTQLDAGEEGGEPP